MSSEPVYVGVDVSKAKLDVAVLPGTEVWCLPHDAAGISSLVDRLRPLAPARIVVEATSILHVPLRDALVAAGLLVSVVNPRNARLSAQASGRLAKTDRIDAIALAEFGAEKHQRLRLAPPHNPELDALRALRDPPPAARRDARSGTEPLPHGVRRSSGQRTRDRCLPECPDPLDGAGDRLGDPPAS